MARIFTRPLLATEHSEWDAGAEALAMVLAQRCSLPLACVLPILSNPEYEALAPQLAEHAEAQAAVRLRDLSATAAAEGVTLELHARRGPEPAHEIVEEAAALGADLIVIRRRGKRGFLANLLLGEMVRHVVVRSPCSVLVVPRAARMWSKRVLAAIDPTATDMTPVAHAAGIAAECGLPLSIVCVTEPAADAMQRAEHALQQAWSTARAFEVTADALLRIGRPHEQIVATARDRGADLIVIGRRGDDRLSHAWIGGVAQKVIGAAEQAVLVSINAPATRTAPSP